MSRTRIHLVLPILVVFLYMVPVASQVSSRDKHEEFWQFVQRVQDILAGKNVEQTKEDITPGARLVYGARFERLRAVVAGEIKGLSLADTSYHGVMIEAETNSSEDTGFLILKTRQSDTTKLRFHTVVFMKDSTGLYKIRTWHTGDYEK